MSSIFSESSSLIEEINKGSKERQVRMRIPTQFHDGPRTVLLQPDGLQLSLHHLPPIEVVLSLPPLYPDNDPPSVREVRAPWLPQPLHVPARQIWQEQAGCMESLLYISEWLGHDLWSPEGQFTDAMGTILLSYKDTPSCRLVYSTLGKVDADSTQADFEAGSYECVICMSSSRGGRCIRLSNCGHTFCTSCLSEGVTLYAKEGNFQLARCCPTIECGTARKEQGSAPAVVEVTQLDLTPPDPILPIIQRSKPCSLKALLVASRAHAHRPGYLTRGEQRTILGAELLARVDRLELENVAGQDAWADFCPICKNVAIVSEETSLMDDDGKPGFGSLLICTKCEFPFCRMCGHAWHGRTRCGGDTGQLADRYSTAIQTNDFDTVADLERRYTRKYLEHLVQVTTTSKESKEWIEANTKPCPTCKVPVVKVDGCNHIHCLHCSGHFCWRCGDSYHGANFYDHYSDPKSRCYNQMVDVVEENDPLFF